MRELPVNIIIGLDYLGVTLISYKGMSIAMKDAIAASRDMPDVL